MEELIIINSADSEVSKRLARMLEEKSYLPCILDDLEGFFELNSTTKPALIIIECQPECLEDSKRVNFIRKLSNDDYLKLILISTREQIDNINEIIFDNHIKFLTKPILYTHFIKEVDQMLNGKKTP